MRRLASLMLPGMTLLVAAACGGSSGAAATKPIQPAAATQAVPVTAISATLATGTCPASAGLAPDVTTHGAAAVSGTKASIDAADSFFTPTCLTGASGAFTLELHNTGKALHNISIPDQGIDLDVPAGKTITVQVKPSGQALQFFCKYHRTSGMVGAITAN